MFLLSAEGVPSVAHFIRLERSAADTVTFAVNSQSAAKPSLAESDRRIEAEAHGAKVVVGLTSRCPYGLAACWGGAYQTLRALSGVDAVKAVANADDSTAEVFLRDNAPPDIDGWIATFRKMANGSYDFRGAEATLSGAVRLEAGRPVLAGPGWSVRLDP